MLFVKSFLSKNKISIHRHIFLDLFFSQCYSLNTVSTKTKEKEIYYENQSCSYSS